MSNYIFSESLAAFRDLTVMRAKRGRNAVLFLEGPPGGGKTAFAKEISKELECPLFRYNGRPDKEHDLLYDFDLSGIVKRENAYIKGAAWKALEASQEGIVILLIDEVDKASKGFDSFLLRLIEEVSFISPNGDVVQGDISNIIFILTSNGRRSIYPEVLRRCQRVTCPCPEGKLFKEICFSMVEEATEDLVGLICRISETLRKDITNWDNWASPKEVAYLADDLAMMATSHIGLNKDLVREVCISYLIKDKRDISLLNKLPFKWLKAVCSEANR